MMPKWLDWLFAAWVVFVGFVYYAGSVGVFTPASGPSPVMWVSERTDSLAMVYAIMLVVCVMFAVFAHLRKSGSSQS